VLITDPKKFLSEKFKNVVERSTKNTAKEFD
jgi:hypothetical protein